MKLDGLSNFEQPTKEVIDWKEMKCFVDMIKELRLALELLVNTNSSILDCPLIEVFEEVQLYVELDMLVNEVETNGINLGSLTSVSVSSLYSVSEGLTFLSKLCDSTLGQVWLIAFIDNYVIGSCEDT